MHAGEQCSRAAIVQRQIGSLHGSTHSALPCNFNDIRRSREVVCACAPKNAELSHRGGTRYVHFSLCIFWTMDAQMHRDVFSRSRSLKSRGRRPCVHPCIDPENPCIRATTRRTPTSARLDRVGLHSRVTTSRHQRTSSRLSTVCTLHSGPRGPAHDRAAHSEAVRNRGPFEARPRPRAGPFPGPFVVPGGP